jgi:two-component system cell cycle sensor histidine kinase/response regulator CckA
VQGKFYRSARREKRLLPGRRPFRDGENMIQAASGSFDDSSRQGRTGMAKGKAQTEYPMPVIDNVERPGTIARLLILGAVLIGSAAAVVLLRDQLGEPFLLGVLGLLAMIGMFYLFATVIGFVQVTPRSTGDAYSKAYIDSVQSGLIINDQKGRILYANRAYADMTGAAGSADLKTVDTIFSSEDEAANVIYRMTNRLQDGAEVDEEFRLSHRLDGSGDEPRWYRGRARALNVPGQREAAFVWELTDISDKRAEQERFFRDLQKAIDHLDHAPAGFFSADPDGGIVYLNATLANWLGVDLTSFTPGELTLSDIVAGDGMALLRAVRTEPGEMKTSTVDLDLAKRNGEVLPVRFLHSVTANRSGVRGPSRTIVLNRTHGEDASAELRASEVRFTRFFNSTPMAIAGIDGDGRIIRTNAPFLRLFAGTIDADAVAGHVNFSSVIHPRDRERFGVSLNAARDKRADIEPIDTVLPDDEERHVRVYVNATADEGGDGAAEEASIVYAVETTEQKALEAQMAQGQKMQAVGQLAGGIAHDFNNVLTAIIMASDLLLTNHRSSDPSFPDIMNIKQNANRAASLVRQLLAFSRRQTLRPEVLDLTDVLADLRMLLSRLAGNEIALEIEHGRDLWPVQADIGQLEQVIVNLTVNARDAMAGGGKIRIATHNVSAEELAELGRREMPRADYVLIEVEDTGTGIPPDVMKKIFEPFFTTKDVGKGTGLGLSMVYGIIKQTGGFIYCDSEPGTGTVFKIYLPRHVVDPQKAREASARAADKAREDKAAAQGRDLSGSATVLLVEDEDAVRMGGVRALRSRGYNVHEASSGVEALEIFRELDGGVDIIVSDVVMPEMDGPTLLSEVRKIQPDIKFIFVSGYAEDAFAKNLSSDAKFGFLPKPFSLKQLATTVKDMLESGSNTTT